MNRPLESDYTSQVAYTRALEAYCDSLAQPDYRAVKTYHEGKPVYVSKLENERIGFVRTNGEAYWIHDTPKTGTDLYTTPPKQQPLTDEQRKAVVICYTSGKVSVSEVQRKMQIRYDQAQQLCQSIVDRGLANGMLIGPSLTRPFEAAYNIK